MSALYAFMAFAALIFIFIYITDLSWTRAITQHYIALVVIGVVVRLLALRVPFGFGPDIFLFQFWAHQLAEVGPGQFYVSGFFADYPPGYMYVLWVIGHVARLLQLPLGSPMFEFLIKTPAMAVDIVTCVFLYKIACKRMTPLYAWLFALAYVINPAIVINSAVWGQVDSIHTFVILLSVFYLTEKKHTLAFVLFTLGVLIKPQTFIFTPVFMWAAFRLGPRKVLKDALLCISIALVLILPFSPGFNIMPVLSQYVSTMAFYDFVALNAYNLYTFLGFNWAPLTPGFIALGAFFIVSIVVIAFYLMFRNSDEANIFFVAALLNTLTFMFSVKMHERYLYPSLVFFLAAYAFKRKKTFLLLYGGFSMTLFVNCADVLYMLAQGNMLSVIERSAPLVSAANLILTGIMLKFAFGWKLQVKPTVAESDFWKSHKVGAGLLAGIVIVYGALAFSHLGDRQAPQTTWDAQDMQSVIIDFGQTRQVTSAMAFLGARHNQVFDIHFYNDSEEWEFARQVLLRNVFAWQEEPLWFEARYVMISPVSTELMIRELAFRQGEMVLPVSYVSYHGRHLTDEQHIVPVSPHFTNSTYFDEIYHPRTAYEFIHGLSVFEWSHPPLGKVIISWGVMLWGMTPFGWRFMGTLFGVLMLPLIYLFAKWMFKSYLWAFFAAAVFALDFMLFTQTRLATIDTYVTFFLLGAYLFMYRYYTRDFKTLPLWESLVPLFFSGIFMGLAIASKWQGFYGAAGLAVLFFYTLYCRYRDGEEGFFKKAGITCACCMIFFVAIPVVIYGLSYIPYLRTPGMGGIGSIIDNQRAMFSYHAFLEAFHPFASPWWEWPFNIRPMFYYAGVTAKGLREGISAFGNPAVWWVGVAAFFYCVAAMSRKFDRNLLFLFIAFGAQFLPWTFVTRPTFIYHYFPSVPFMVLMICYMFKNYFYPRGGRYVVMYLAAVMLLFVMFYPVLAGRPVSFDFVNTFLRWLPTWQLV